MKVMCPYCGHKNSFGTDDLPYYFQNDGYCEEGMRCDACERSFVLTVEVTINASPQKTEQSS